MVTTKITFRDVVRNVKIIPVACVEQRSRACASFCASLQKYVPHFGYSIDRFLPDSVEVRCILNTFVISGSVFMILGGVFVLCSATAGRSVGRATRS